jgi:hypothetical protein
MTRADKVNESGRASNFVRQRKVLVRSFALRTGWSR